MLASLTVRDIVLIERSDLGFAPGLNVLTGETGAGKSILLDALGLAAGGRGTGRAGVRVGAESGSAIAVFEIAPGHPVHKMLAENGLETEGEVILRRSVSADGRTRAFINDAPVGVQLLREIGAALLEVHGQADDRGLFDSSTHRVLLDEFGGHGDLVNTVAKAHGAYAAARMRTEELLRASVAAAGESEYLTHAAEELAELDPQPGEEQSLAEQRSLLMNAGKIAAEIQAAADFVGGEQGAENALAQALRRLSRMSEEGKRASQAAESALDSALALVQDARRELDALLTKLELDPSKLEDLEDRFFALKAAARKYNVTAEKLPELRKEFEAKLALLDHDGSALAAANAEAAKSKAAFLEAAKKLSSARTKAAAKLEQAVAKELAPLKLGHARFRVGLSPLPEDEAGAGGLERAGFEVATVEGAAFGSLAKIASGGELARFALALKVALAEASPPAVLVFDEVDRGVGGAVADAVGERLQRLAKTTQVLLVTHSPQVAARAARHFRITRAGDATRVAQLGAEERLEEIARMLSGAAVTVEARAAAKRLLSEAEGKPAEKAVTASKKQARA